MTTSTSGRSYFVATSRMKSCMWRLLKERKLQCKYWRRMKICLLQTHSSRSYRDHMLSEGKQNILKVSILVRASYGDVLCQAANLGHAVELVETRNLSSNIHFSIDNLQIYEQICREHCKMPPCQARLWNLWRESFLLETNENERLQASLGKTRKLEYGSISAVQGTSGYDNVYMLYMSCYLSPELTPSIMKALHTWRRKLRS